MAHFLRDQQITNLSATEDNLIQISSTFADRAAMINASVPEDAHLDKGAFVTYVIRFDNKGYRVFSVDELFRCFREAKMVERVLFTVETADSLRSNRQFGAFMELRLDEREPNSSFLTVTSDDKDWVDASFSAIQDTLEKSRNRNGWVRTAWTVFAVQLVGVTFGFILSLWVGSKIAPRLSIENAFLFSFLFALLVFSNTWTFLNQLVLRLMNVAFPNIKFLRRGKERLHWLMQAVVGGIVGAAALYVLGQLVAFVSEILSGFVS
ncbi:MAG TPA: hypothetical protein VIF10_13835 [Methylobacter sp.]|jgi:hypothetical protein